MPHQLEHFSWVFQPRLALGSVHCLEDAGRVAALAPIHQRPSLIPSEAFRRDWAPCRAILGKDSNSPGANYPYHHPLLSFFFPHLLFFISLLLPVHCSIASVSAAALNHESYESFGFSLFLGGYSLSFLFTVAPDSAS